MNYGYSELNGTNYELELSDAEQLNQYCIQLYHHVADPIYLTGKYVHESGSGRDGGEVDLVRKQLKDDGLKLVTERDITANVVRAMELDNDRKEKLIERKCPKVLRREAEEFAAIRGTRTFEAFKSGSSRYLSFVLQKEPLAIT